MTGGTWLPQLSKLAGLTIPVMPGKELPEVKDIWYGFRPCSPDGLPYLGYSKKLKNLIVAG
eukprot:gene13333-17001_t